MPEYLSPGVYVEEVPSAIKPIAGVSTSTAAFVGVVPDRITILEENPDFDPTPGVPPADNPRTISWVFPLDKERDWQAAKDALDRVSLPNSRPLQAAANVAPADFRRARANFAQAQTRLNSGTMAPAGEPVLCTSFTDFTRSFGSFSTDGLQTADPNFRPVSFHNRLAHAVYGFFQNGGMRCYVMRYPTLADLQDPLHWLPLEAIDEISIVAAPGVDDPSGIVQSNLIDHCEATADRFAIVDAPPDPAQYTVQDIKVPDRNTVYGGLYFPYLRVFDMQTKLMRPETDGVIDLPASGHIAGIYSRVDHERGVFKAPANEVVRGAVDVGHQISRSQQDGLNPYGINCVRFINDAITVWGARTIGGDANTDLKYINVRRTLIFLRKSIDAGTQWAVFEPNDRSLWAKLVRNVSAFLTTVWSDGALFGSTAAEAFYVRCDDVLNPPEMRDLGQVTVEIGVAIVRPAEFVVFRISQWVGPAAG